MPELDAKLGITIAIFCAGAPSSQGTLEMLRQLGVEDWSSVKQLRYRGYGWPGRAAVTLVNEDQERSLSYSDSWGGILEKHRPWRCRLCIDHTGEFADIAVGDPWYRTVGADEAGSSLVVVRTERGRQFLAAAIESGVVELQRVGNELLPQSQPNLLQTRGAIWGRLVMSRPLAVPVPRYRNMPTARIWWGELSPLDKLRSFSGTAKRIVRRRLRRRVPVIPAVELDPAQGGEDV
jgi:coenzyme F420 hydrogenase subunit beta